MLLEIKDSHKLYVEVNQRIRQRNHDMIKHRLICDEEKIFAQQATIGMILMWKSSANYSQGYSLPFEIILLIVSFIEPSRVEAKEYSKVCHNAFLYGKTAKKEYIEAHGKSYEELEPYQTNPFALFC